MSYALRAVLNCEKTLSAKYDRHRDIDISFHYPHNLFKGDKLTHHNIAKKLR